jgi:hypothetical protein
MKMKTLQKAALPICLSVCIAGSAMAAETTAPSDEWHFTLAPLFLWGMNVDGTSQIGPVSAPLEIGFTDDVLENLSAVFTVHFEAQKGDWTLFAEYQYVDLDPSVEISPVASADIDFQDQLGELGVAYKVATFGINDLEVLGGARYTRQDLKVNLNLGPVLVNVTETWWDGFAGLRIFTHISDSWTFIGRADIGGGGSDFVWNLVGMFDYQFKDWGSVFFGYRWLDYDYDSGSGLDRYAYDATQSGPLAGLSFYW